MHQGFEASHRVNGALYSRATNHDQGGMLLSVFNRIFEKTMYNLLKSYTEDNELLYNAQCGFREKISTQHAILDIVNTIQTNMDKKMFTCGVFIDFKKAFDTVNHTILLDELHHYGIRGIVHEWFLWYLAN